MQDREAIEHFHLLFSHRLAAKIDRNLFCLKGGCNLRFFFRSIRYSEDIDFDIHTISVDTLKKNVAKLLDDPAFITLLRNQSGTELVDWSDPKQTETTQRWKVQLRAGGRSIHIPTKIEFSRRNVTLDSGLVEPVDPRLTNQYRLQPIILRHYQLSRAIEQKISALINRTETQARDVIDIKILKDQIRGETPVSVSGHDKVRAVETLMSVSYDDFKSQVWPFLMAEYQEFYEKRATWDQLQEEVIQFIEAQSEAAP